ncbi:50S ribosomal protein L11 methyltransferase [Rhodocytophaga aerolata]|uniref:50S ribosomal protein L11 methyltransferase n=1 Tax=Rhodocytophaga aerolata TaxID=455078 RepID=A0ABT8RDP7_9BACT|nr:50S ribosomal protein L11 methyltransferase [Rhodocytophaga aerolata]
MYPQLVKGKSMFAQENEIRHVTVQEQNITLELNQFVFAPSPNGSFYANTLGIYPQERVIDIGTGSGVLAIYAAKKGAIVSATDIEVPAVELARRNAQLNGVPVEVRLGSLFGDFDGPFEVIIANLPNEIVPPVYAHQLGQQLADTFDGGESGNRFILELLDKAKTYMHAKSRLYLPVHTLTDYHQVLQTAISSYNVKLLALAQLPAKEFVQQNLAYYLTLNEQGIIRVFKQGDTWYTNGYIYEVTLKTNPA